MAIDPDSLKPLQEAVRIEIARQIDARRPDARKLVEQGFSWNLAFAIVREMKNEDAANVTILTQAGLSAAVAEASARAINSVPRPKPAPILDSRGSHMRAKAITRRPNAHRYTTKRALTT
jgi:hypothetical protein